MDNYESKILSYTSDIERLQAQIKELQKQKEQELTEIEKYTPGPNMMVMTKWLDGIQKYRENMKKMRIPIFSSIQVMEPAEFAKAMRHKKITVQNIAIFGNKNLNTQMSEMSNWITSKQRQKINIDNKISSVINHPINDTEFSQEQLFMENFVRSTYNLFQIFQERIDNLEQKLKRSSL